MPVALTVEQRAALRQSSVAIRTLIDFHLDSGRYSLWDGDAAVAFDGTTYMPASDWGEISNISLGADLGAEGMEIRVNGTKLRELSPDPFDPAALFGTIEQENYQMRRVDIRFAFFDMESGLLLLLIRRYAGFIDQARQVEEIGDDGRAQCWLVLALESIARRYSVRGARTRSNDDQQDIWAGDTGFKMTASALAKRGSLSWGRLPPGGVLGVGGSPLTHRPLGERTFTV